VIRINCIKNFVQFKYMSQRDNASCLESLENFLLHSIRPLIIEGLISIRSQGQEFAKQNNSEMNEVQVTVQLLKEIRNWTQVLLDEEVKRILNKIPFLQKLLTALFVMKVKVLSVINMRKDTQEFPLTIPANSTFIHHVYIQCANILVDNSNVLEEMNLIDLAPLVQEGIRNACLACIEWSDLLSWGLDGVNVNEVITKIMNEEQVESKPDNGDNDDIGDSSEDVHMTDDAENNDTDADFMSMSNDEKRQDAETQEEEHGGEEHEEQSETDRKEYDDNQEGGDTESMFDLPENENETTESHAGDDHAGNEQLKDNNESSDAKVVSSSNPSFF